MKRIAAIGLTVFLLWALVPAIGELVENALHFVQEGHTAHAAADGDHHDPADPEHGCTGATHLCSCCVSLSCVQTGSACIRSLPSQSALLAADSSRIPVPAGRRLYHPPRV